MICSRPGDAISDLREGKAESRFPKNLGHSAPPLASCRFATAAGIGCILLSC